jgi:predicted DNA-binding transcriptional regulator AlpA
MKKSSFDLLTRKETTQLIPVSERTLDRYRFRKVNPIPFIALSPRRIRFLRSDVEAWIARNRVGEVS